MAPDPVPRFHQVVPGAHVSIILKADQRTGRQVQGTVQHVLTRHDHHRGIKVRLTDGRVGRVQTMTPGTDGESSTPLSSSLMSMNSFRDASHSGNAGGSRGRGRRPRFQDGEQPDAVMEPTDLGAYIVPSRHRAKAKEGANASRAAKSDDRDVGPNINGRQATDDLSSALATCPVCGGFEGDETAVAYHVAGHFGP